MDAYTFLAQQESVFCEAASSASVAGLIKHGVPEGSRVVCVLTGHGLKDPDLAIKAISVPSVIDLDLHSVLAEISLLGERSLARTPNDLPERGVCWHDPLRPATVCVSPLRLVSLSAGTSGLGRAPRSGEPGEGIHTRIPSPP